MYYLGYDLFQGDKSFTFKIFQNMKIRKNNIFRPTTKRQLRGFMGPTGHFK